MGNVSRDARLLFVQLLTVCDDYGKARGSSRVLASLLYPYDDDARDLIDGWLAELEREGCVRRYQVDRADYIRVENWKKHQKVDHPSKVQFPDPLDTLADPREASRGTPEGYGPGPVYGPIAISATPPPGPREDGGQADQDGPDVASLLFGQALTWLVAHSGRTERDCRTLIGRWRKATTDAGLIVVLGDAQRHGIIEPIGWIERAIAGFGGGKRSPLEPAGLPITPWDQRVRAFREKPATGRKPFWLQDWGPNPDQAGCGAPPDVLARYPAPP